MYMVPRPTTKTTDAPYHPSPAEIVARCARIQASWSNKERRRRAIRAAAMWLPPVVALLGEERAAIGQG